jgi:hypothetical protein
MLVLNIALCVFLLLSSLVGCGPGWTWQTVKVTLVPSQTRGMGAGVARRRRAMNVKRSRQSNCFLIRNSWGREQGSLVAFVATPGIYSTLLWNHPSSFCESKLSRLCCSGIKLSRKLQLLINLSKKNHTQRICHFNFVRCDCLPRNTFRGSLGGVIEGFRSTDLTSHVERAHVQASTALGSRLQRNFFRDRPSKPMVWSVHSPYAIIKTHKRNDQIFLIKWLQISCREQSLTLGLFRDFSGWFIQPWSPLHGYIGNSYFQVNLPSIPKIHFIMIHFAKI